MTNDLLTLVRSLAGRDLNREGIPVFLTLEDLISPSSPKPPRGRLHALAEEYLARLTADSSPITDGDVAKVLEILGAQHFDDHFTGTEDVEISTPNFGDSSPGTFVRAVNYHNTPRSLAPEYERRLLSAGERFRSVSEEDLTGLISGRGWPHTEPPVLPVFYEGYRNNYDVALPILERAGLRGWFFIPTAFIDTPVAGQRRFAEAHDIGLAKDEHGDGRYAMTWDELRDVASRGHIVACHTATHCAAASIGNAEDAERELIRSRARLEEELGCDIRTLAWLYGTPYGEDERVDSAVRGAGYGVIFSGTKIQRIRRNTA